jgi:serine/threonine protein kinase
MYSRMLQRYRLIEPRVSSSAANIGNGVLGEGAYGVVYKAQDTETGVYVALKKIKLEHESDGISPSALREITILMQLSHENIVQLCDVLMEPQRLSLIFELVDMDLYKYMHSHTLSVDTSQHFTYFLLRGLAYLHSMGVMHRDLKPQK